ncbi:MAG: hypothetical protein FJ150_02770 [Euryarchaeota archaeon]|nr:hypothetical protein [Euryarchaeota archaeon]
MDNNGNKNKELTPEFIEILKISMDKNTGSYLIEPKINHIGMLYAGLEMARLRIDSMAIEANTPKVIKPKGSFFSGLDSFLKNKKRF